MENQETRDAAFYEKRFKELEISVLNNSRMTNDMKTSFIKSLTDYKNNPEYYKKLGEEKRKSRIKGEIKKIKKSKFVKCGLIDIDINNNFITKCFAFIKGGENTPYQGGIFALEIIIPKDYPFVPPKITIETKILHPYINYNTGEIYLNILDKEWSPVFTLEKLIISIESFINFNFETQIDDSKCECFMDAPDIKQIFKNDKSCYNTMVADFVAKNCQIENLSSQYKSYYNNKTRVDQITEELLSELLS